jgi:hypothetical protein
VAPEVTESVWNCIFRFPITDIFFLLASEVTKSVWNCRFRFQITEIFFLLASEVTKSVWNYRFRFHSGEICFLLASEVTKPVWNYRFRFHSGEIFLLLASEVAKPLWNCRFRLHSGEICFLPAWPQRQRVVHGVAESELIPARPPETVRTCERQCPLSCPPTNRQRGYDEDGTVLVVTLCRVVGTLAHVYALRCCVPSFAARPVHRHAQGWPHRWRHVS